MPDYKLWSVIEEAAQDEREAVERYVNLAQAIQESTSLSAAEKSEGIMLCNKIAAMEMEHSEWLTRFSTRVSGVAPSKELHPIVTVQSGSWPPNV